MYLILPFLRFFSQCKIILLVSALVLLQVLQPFLHAHNGAEHALALSGLHVASEDVLLTVSQLHVQSATLEVPHNVHIDSVGVATKHDIDLGYLFNPLIWLVASLLLALCVLSIRPFYHQNPTVHQIRKRRLPAPRAPPAY